MGNHVFSALEVDPRLTEMLVNEAFATMNQNKTVWLVCLRMDDFKKLDQLGRLLWENKLGWTEFSTLIQQMPGTSSSLTDVTGAPRLGIMFCFIDRAAMPLDQIKRLGALAADVVDADVLISCSPGIDHTPLYEAVAHFTDEMVMLNPEALGAPKGSAPVKVAVNRHPGSANPDLN